MSSNSPTGLRRKQKIDDPRWRSGTLYNVHEGQPMVVAKISNPGLMTMAVLVIILWACLIGERLTVNRANVELHLVLQSLRHSRTHAHQQQRSKHHTGRAGSLCQVR